MYVREISSHRHAATITTDTLRVRLAGFRDSEGREHDEVVVTVLGQQEPTEEIHGRQVRVIRVERSQPEEGQG